MFLACMYCTNAVSSSADVGFGICPPHAAQLADAEYQPTGLSPFLKHRCPRVSQPRGQGVPIRRRRTPVRCFGSWDATAPACGVGMAPGGGPAPGISLTRRNAMPLGAGEAAASPGKYRSADARAPVSWTGCEIFKPSICFTHVNPAGLLRRPGTATPLNRATGSASAAASCELHLTAAGRAASATRARNSTAQVPVPLVSVMAYGPHFQHEIRGGAGVIGVLRVC